MKINSINFYTEQEKNDWHELYNNVERKHGMFAILSGIITAALPLLLVCLSDCDKNILLILSVLAGCLCIGGLVALGVWEGTEDAFNKYREKTWNSHWMKNGLRKQIYDIYQHHKIIEIKADKTTQKVKIIYAAQDGSIEIFTFPYNEIRTDGNVEEKTLKVTDKDITILKPYKH